MCSIAQPPTRNTDPVRPRGFTLVELLVVTAVIGILAALMLPAIARFRDKAREKRANTSEVMADSALAIHREVMPTLPQDFTTDKSIIDRLQMDIELHSAYRQRGMGVDTSYEARYALEINVRVVDPTKNPLVLFVPFPEGHTEIRDTRLTVTRTADGEEWEPADTVLHPTGIYWKGTQPANEALTVSVQFTALGREPFYYRLPPAQRLNKVAITMSLAEVDAWRVPETALQPTTIDGDSLAWNYDGILTQMPLAIEMPGAQSALGRVTLLFRLVGAAVFLFGLGFWYLSGLRDPGQLREFRWGHFLLLALNFSLYFVFFGVFAHKGALGVSTMVFLSALFSLPLLILHVSRVLNLHFALTRVTPLAVVALGFVTVGVYGGAARDYLFLAGALLLMAFLTLTYQQWLAVNAAYRDRRSKEMHERLEKIRDTYQENVVPALHQLMDADHQAAQVLSARGSLGPNSDESVQGGRLEYIRQRARLLFEREKAVREQMNRYTTWNSFNDSFDKLDDIVERGAEFKRLLTDCADDLRQAIAGWRQSQGDATGPTDGDGGSCCPACGASGPGLPYCPQCGEAQPITLTCPGCAATMTLPVHLLGSDGAHAHIHCTQCGLPAPLP